MKKLLFSFAFAVASSAALAAPIVQNSGFEAGGPGNATGWGRADATYSYVSGEGRNGTRAIFFDVKADSPYAFPSQRFNLTPGVRYRVEGWVRTENLVSEKGGASFALEWRLKDGTYRSGRTAPFTKGTSSGFVKVTLDVTAPSDPSIGTYTLSPFVTAKSTGKAWFDDFSINPVVLDPVGQLATDAYRNTVYRGPVTVSAVIRRNADEIAKLGLRANLSFTGADGSRVRVDAPIADGYARGTFDSALLKLGKTDVELTLSDSSGRTLGKGTIPLARTASEPNWKVRIDRGLTRVNGELFFPLGIYLEDRISAARIAEIKQSAFNTVLSYREPTREELDLAHKAGLKVIYAMNASFYATRACRKEITDLKSERAWVESHVAQFKDHPALLAWYINDELGVELRDRLAARRDLVASLDPEHPTYVALYQVDDFPEYIGTYDIIGSDPYPICQVGNPAISQVTEHTRITRLSACGCAMWQIPQIFDWGCYRKRDVAKTRAPTYDEMRSMAWQFIAGGANGLVTYCLTSLHRMNHRDPFEIQWQKVCALYHEIAAYVPVFLSTENGAAVTDVPSGVGVRTWRYRGRDYVLCVNTTRDPVSTSISVSGHGRVPLALGPIGVEMKELQIPGSKR